MKQIGIGCRKRSSMPEVFGKKSILRSFAKFTGKHLYQSLFLIKLQAYANCKLN